MAQEGATVVIVGRTASKLETVTSEIKAAGGIAESYAVNVADCDAVQHIVSRCA